MYEAIARNQRRSVGLVVALALVLAGAGYVLADAMVPGMAVLGAGIGFAAALVLAVGAYFGGDQLLLRSAGAHPLGPGEEPRLRDVVEEIALAAGLPVPAIWLIEDPAPNAFATGRSPKTATVAVTRGLLERLDRAELQGVVAHELGHVQNRDVLYMTLAASLLGAVVILAQGARLLAFAPAGRRSGRRGGGAGIGLLVALVLLLAAVPLSRLLYLAVSRQREYLADATSALLTRYPEGLASALEKIATSPTRLSTSEPTGALCIVNPLQRASADDGWLTRLFATHPPTARRVAVLRAMGGGTSYADYERAYASAVGHPIRPPAQRSTADDPRSRRTATGART